MSTLNRILIVDDEQSMRELLSIMLRKEGYEVVTADNGEKALKAVQNDIFDLVVTDLKMPLMDGMTLLKAVKEASPDTIVIIVTAFGTTEGAEKARSLGAYDYIGKPFNNDEIKLVIQNALEKRHLRKENILLKREIESRTGFENFIGKSEPMQKIFSLIRQVADTKSTVLITGESGTGKELVARALHAHSSRNTHPFVTVNCGALPETLLESELFGYMKGSFTGAVANKQGLFEAANGGTIFLDEISTMTPALQVKLLRVLQEREFKRVGGTADIKVDVRVIAATNRELLADVNKGLFREDLYYRLNVVSLKLPALADRREDIPLLATHFLRKLAERYKRPALTLAPEAMAMLIAAPWPGNVRQLLNLLEQAVALATTTVIPATLVQSALREDASALVPFEEARKTFERDYLVRLLKITSGNVTQAALLAKRNRTEFYKLLQRHRLEPAMFKEGKSP